MSMIVRKKPQEETAMEKRNTTIVNFILGALVPLLLMLFLGFSLKKGTLQNEENLDQKFTALSKKHEALNQNIIELDTIFNRADALYKNLDQKDYDELVQQIAEIESAITLNRWNNDRDAKIDGFEHAINKIRDDRKLEHDDELQQLLVLSSKWLREIAKAKNAELSALKLIREKEITQKESVSSSGGADLQELVTELKMQLLQKDFELTRLGDSKADSETDAQETNSSLQRKYNKVLEGNKTVKANIEAELTAINEEVLPKLEGGIFSKDDIKKLKEKIKAKVDNIKMKTGSLKTDD